jgi:hypothetical protein
VQHYFPSSTHHGASVTERERVRAWENAVRTTCESMEGDDLTIQAASVTLPGGADGEVALAYAVVEDIAEEYGLQVTFTLDRDALTARFSREVTAA